MTTNRQWRHPFVNSLQFVPQHDASGGVFPRRESPDIKRRPLSRSNNINALFHIPPIRHPHMYDMSHCPSPESSQPTGSSSVDDEEFSELLSNAHDTRFTTPAGPGQILPCMPLEMPEFHLETHSRPHLDPVGREYFGSSASDGVVQSTELDELNLGVAHGCGYVPHQSVSGKFP